MTAPGCAVAISSAVEPDDASASAATERQTRRVCLTRDVMGVSLVRPPVGQQDSTNDRLLTASRGVCRTDAGATSKPVMAGVEWEREGRRELMPRNVRNLASVEWSIAPRVRATRAAS